MPVHDEYNELKIVIKLVSKSTKFFFFFYIKYNEGEKIPML